MSRTTEVRSWEPMALKSVGLISDVVRQGGGKLTLVGGDPGEPLRKPKGQE
jgi:hypothetical protein